MAGTQWRTVAKLSAATAAASATIATTWWQTRTCCEADKATGTDPVATLTSSTAKPSVKRVAASSQIPTQSMTGNRVVVVGGGIIGAAIAAEIAGRKCSSVVQIDATHPVRSSWGDTRGLQYGYEGVYAQMVSRAHHLWLRMNPEKTTADSGGPGSSSIFTSAQHLAIGRTADVERQIELYHAAGRKARTEVLSREDVLSKFPMVHVPTGQMAVLDTDCLVFDVPACLAHLHDVAEAHGAVLRHGETVVSIDRERREVHTDEGNTFAYDELVLATGPWTNQCLSMAGIPPLPLFVSMEQLIYFGLDDSVSVARHSNGSMPIVSGLWRGKDSDCPSFCYVFPAFHGGAGEAVVKVATHMQGEFMHTHDFQIAANFCSLAASFPSGVFHRRNSALFMQPKDDELDVYQAQIVDGFVAAVLPELREQQRAGSTKSPTANNAKFVCRCLYTSTPDLHFIVGPHPEDPDVFVATGFHGEGFKFAPVIAECIADAVAARVQRVFSSEDTRTQLLSDLMLQVFDPGRFSESQP